MTRPIPRNTTTAPRRALLALPIVVCAVLAASTAALAHPRSPVSHAAMEMSDPGAIATSRDAAMALAAASREGAAPSTAAASREGAAPGATAAIAPVCAVIVLVVAARRRRVVALGLILIAGLLAFETGVHSVHHLGSPRDLSECVVAVAAAHVPGAIEAPAALLAGPEHALAAPSVPAPPCVTAVAWRAWRGRAPPPIVPA